MRTSTSQAKNRFHRAAASASNTADRAISSAKRGKDRLREEADDLIESGSSTLEDLANQTGRALHNAYEEGQAKLNETAETAREMVQTRPLATLAGAFVAGLFASMLIRR